MTNRIRLCIAGICLLLAGVILYWQWPQPPQDVNSIPASRTTWVKCRFCDYVDQVSERDFIQQQRATMVANRQASATAPALTCPHCKKSGVVEAERCEQCKTVFISDASGTDFPDRCPKCQTSSMENSRRNL